MNIVRPTEIARILAITDALRIHREAVRIPLVPSAEGRVRIEKGALVVEVPQGAGFDAFLESLPGTIAALPGRAELKPA